MVVSCPLCAYNLDFRQDDAKRLNPDFKHMPVLYFTQLMALAPSIAATTRCVSISTILIRAGCSRARDLA